MEDEDIACEPDEFKCLHLNLNQILTMHDWNRHPKKCIPQSYRYLSKTFAKVLCPGFDLFCQATRNLTPVSSNINQLV